MSVKYFICIFILLFLSKKIVDKYPFSSHKKIYIFVILLFLLITFISGLSDYKIDFNLFISSMALVITLYTYVDGTNKTLSHNRNENDIKTFFKLLDLLKNEIQSIKRDSVIDLLKETSNEINSEDNFDKHLAYELMKVFHNNSTTIKKMVYKTNDEELIRKIEKLTVTNKREQYLRFMFNRRLQRYLHIKLKYIVRRTKFNDTEIEKLETCGLLKYISKKYSMDIARKDSITYLEAHDVINRKFENNKYENDAFFRIFNRAIKTIKESDLPNKSKYYGILRAMIPNYLLNYIYYDSTFTDSGLGLGMLLIGTSFFGNGNDFQFYKKSSTIASFSQHIDLKYLLFKRQDVHIMIDLYSNKRIIKTKDDFIKIVRNEFENINITFKKSFVKNIK